MKVVLSYDMIEKIKAMNGLSLFKKRFQRKWRLLQVIYRVNKRPSPWSCGLKHSRVSRSAPLYAVSALSELRVVPRKLFRPLFGGGFYLYKGDES